ncbi:DUF2461 domain-containing protein [bacterium]|nr:DUF2461 domain-containing protein [bacterium]
MTKENLFQGFSLETFKFLKDLRQNNNKTWFEENRGQYEICLLTPFKNLITDLGDLLFAIDPYIESHPAINKTISKIFRDTRFSKDKSPFRSRMWATFKRPNKNWADSPAFFLEISPDSYRFGMGLYSASPNTMSRLREAIDDSPEAFLESISFYSRQSGFILGGDQYKRAFKNDHSQAIQEWYQRKNIYLVCERGVDDRVVSPKLIDDLVSGFNELAPFYRYLWAIRK